MTLETADWTGARTWSEMSAAKQRRDAAFYAGRDDQAERARTEAARTAARA
mgnify:CR=1 FL=1